MSIPRGKDSRARAVERRRLLQLAGTMALGRVIGLGAAQSARGITSSVPSGGGEAARPYPFPVEVLFHGSRARREIALTFDACPRKERPEFSTEIVNYLQREHIPATFFYPAYGRNTVRTALSNLQKRRTSRLDCTDIIIGNRVN